MIIFLTIKLYIYKYITLKNNMEFLKRLYYSTKERSKTPKKNETYDYKNDMSNKFARTNILFTILYNKFE